MSSICDEQPRLIREDPTVEMKGKRYQLELTGGLWSREQWAGSEYYERIETIHWFEGEGSITSLENGRAPAHFMFTATGKPSMYNYSTREIPYELDTNVLSTKYWQNHLERDPRELIVKERFDDYIDFICERALKKYDEQFGKKVPRLYFPNMEGNELVANGFAYGSRGQISPPLAAAK